MHILPNSAARELLASLIRGGFPSPRPSKSELSLVLFPHEDGVRGLARRCGNYLAAIFTASVGRLDKSAWSVSMVERSQTPSTLAGRKCRWKAETTSIVALSYLPVTEIP